MTKFSSLRVRLVGTVLLTIAPAGVVLYFADKYYLSAYGAPLPWELFTLGLLALGAAWYGGERFILRQVRILYQAASKLAGGDLTARTGLSKERGELGELARTFDSMAASLEQRDREREQAGRTLLNRAFQQTVVSAIGQFAMVSSDISALLDQAVMLAAQNLEVEYCHVLELAPGGNVVLFASGRWLEEWRSSIRRRFAADLQNVVRVCPRGRRDRVASRTWVRIRVSGPVRCWRNMASWAAWRWSSRGMAVPGGC